MRGLVVRGATFVVASVTLAVACSPRPRWPGVTDGCPDGMVSIAGRFCIDRWEAGVVEIMPDGERPLPPYGAVGARFVRAVSRPGAVPQAYISKNEAERACRAAEKRLCREHEWVEACRGPRRLAYPYGDQEVRGACNDDGVTPLLRLFAASGVNPYADKQMNDPRLNQLPKTVSPSGGRDRCVNEYGVFDMVGNLHEWVDDPGGTFVGGYFLDTRLNGRGCSYKTTAHDASYHDYSTGFRCCADIRR